MSLREDISLIHKYSICNDVQGAKKLLDKEPLSINNLDSDGQTPLHCAVICGYLNMSKLLMNYGADPYLVDRYEDTPVDCLDYSDEWLSESDRLELKNILIGR